MPGPFDLMSLLSPRQRPTLPSTDSSDTDIITGLLQQGQGLDSLVDSGGSGRPQTGRGGTPGGPFWDRFGGDIENLYSGVPGHDKSHLHLAAEQGPLKKLLKRIERMGFTVGEHPAFDKVDPVHTENSWHYKGRAGDINWYNPSKGRASRFGNEDQALTWLEGWLRKHGLG